MTKSHMMIKWVLFYLPGHEVISQLKPIVCCVTCNDVSFELLFHLGGKSQVGHLKKRIPQ